MRYWDTAALLRAWKEDWVPAGGMTRSHTVAEWMAIQTGRGMVYRTPQGQLVKRNLSPRDAAREIRKLVARLTFRDLTAEEVLASTERAARIPGIQGNSFHDFLHVCTAERHGAKSIVTLNLHDYSRMTKLPLEIPAQGMG
jgi:predicted nucleic acid-binding protein